MADQADVEAALVTLAAQALYPNGTDAPSVAGVDCRIYRGWPSSAALDADLAAGRINVTVFPVPDETRVTTRYAQEWSGLVAVAGLNATVCGETITLRGVAEPDQLVGIRADGLTYVYRTQAGDTPDLVAAALASQARVHWIVHLTAGVITICGVADLEARVVADVPVMREVRRQEQGFRITCWCPTPAARDVSAAAIDLALSQVAFIDLPDTTTARLIYQGTTVFDQSQDALLYRRDLLYRTEYATIVSDRQPAMLFGDLGLNAIRVSA